jgi:hypothetical protein
MRFLKSLVAVTRGENIRNENFRQKHGQDSKIHETGEMGKEYKRIPADRLSTATIDL